MGEWSHIRDVLNDIENLDHVLDVSFVSRGGLYIMGDPPSGAHQETFAAMLAIILGAAETTSAELKDSLKSVTIELSDRDLILTEAGPRYMLAITVDREGDIPSIIREAKKRIASVEINI